MRAMGPPAAASGLTCPTAGPLVAPEKRPSVIRATEVESPMPQMAEVGVEHLAHARAVRPAPRSG